MLAKPAEGCQAPRGTGGAEGALSLWVLPERNEASWEEQCAGAGFLPVSISGAGLRLGWVELAAFLQEILKLRKRKKSNRLQSRGHFCH
jgi:hypothetical protein